MKRKHLFKLQGWLSILLILVATINYALSAEGAEFIKVAIAPFGAISLLLFSFFVYNRRREDLNDEENFGGRKILANLCIVLVSAVVVITLTSILGDLTSSLDRIIFSFSIMIGAVIFLFEKIRDLRSMAILTGIGEGITVLMIFFR